MLYDEKYYYDILNISENSDIDSIKKAYRKLSLKYHPDKNNNTTNELFKNITSAYEYLSKKNISNIYDPQYNNNNSLKKYTDICDINLYNNTAQNMFSDNNCNKYKEDIPISLDITYEQAYNGSNVPIIINRFIMNNNISQNEKETLYVEIPKGIDNDEIIIIKERGNIYNNISSNIKILINLLKHDFYTRTGLDLHFMAKISFKESLIGFNFILKHLNNKSYKIVNTKREIVHNKTTIHLPQLGFERNNFRGNLTINFIIDYPKSLAPEIIEKLKEIL